MKSGAKKSSKQVKRKSKALKGSKEDSSSIAGPAKKPKVVKTKHLKLKHKKVKKIDSSKDVVDLEKVEDIIPSSESEKSLTIVDKDAALLDAVREGSLDQVNNLIAQGANPCAIDKKENTALMVALMCGYTHIAKVLIKAGADNENIMETMKKLMLVDSYDDGIAQILKLSDGTFLDFMGAHYLKIGLDDSLLRIKCEQCAGESSPAKKKLLLKEIESILIKIKEGSLLSSFSTSGVKKLPKRSHSVIKMAYLLEDEALTQLFAKYLPVPRADFFQGAVLPKYIANREEQRNKAISDFLYKNKSETYGSLEKRIMKIQRHFRAKKRQKEEHSRISNKYKLESIDSENLDIFGSPYIPKRCSPELAQRIVRVAAKTKFLNNIRHITHQSSLTSIFDNALFGQKTLRILNLSFFSAALHDYDIEEGDGNVICFGAEHGEIDPQADGNVELTFQLNKIDFGRNKTVHCAFFKQQDLGYIKPKNRRVNISQEKQIVFSHTRRSEEHGNKPMHLEYQKMNESFDGVGRVHNYKLISYDINNIDSVLILNFFRYLDNLTTYSREDASHIISAIYSDIEKMNDEELGAFLEKVGRNLSDTMEFNFFGAHQIDFDALTTIRDRFTRYCLNMGEFILELQNGKLEMLNAAKEAFSAIFRSYRFLDYLSTKTDNPRALAELSALRSICKVPDWYPKNGKLESPVMPLVVQEVEHGAKEKAQEVEQGAKEEIQEAEQGAKEKVQEAEQGSPHVFTPQRNQQRRKRQTEVAVPVRWSKRIAAKKRIDASESFVAKRGCYKV